ncbi:Leucine Rich Repeat family protein [Histomonas meleagridis]|uniref:Leucine Rich Repeat family protein n=1 Tax=Histomonas meleagridis TaxID=135588 RepID=UPI00355A47EF|nr:Leucine Rich Repeat family protein [Histomonas meleagridis]KAH0805028.1 Leucine Rich Repeat family protein [Histomonas meleagridis]
MSDTPTRHYIKKTPISPRLIPKVTSPKPKVQNNSSYVSFKNQRLTSIDLQGKYQTVNCLDVENNKLTNESIKELPNTIISLNLTSNPLTSCFLPNLEKLHSLLLDNCNVTSFEGFPCFPNLRFLSMSNNQISNFNKFPVLQNLETINLSGNTFDFTSKITIAAVGSVYLRYFNEKQLTEEELENAFKLSPIVGVALRQGRDPSEQDDEISFSQKFLTEDLSDFLSSQGEPTDKLFLQEETEDDHTIIKLPYDDSTSIKWYRNQPPNKTNEEWGLVEEGTPTLIINQDIKHHIIKCDFELNGRLFSIYSDRPVSSEDKYLYLPFPIEPKISGEPFEGSFLSLLPTSIPTYVTWLCESEIICKNSKNVFITPENVGKTITCQIQPYLPSLPSQKFNIITIETNLVKSLTPFISNVSFPETITENETIEFDRLFIPKNSEGESVITIERTRNPSEQWQTISTIEPNNFIYTPRIDDVDFYLRVKYIPITKNGNEGKTTYFYSKSRVVPSLPKFSRPTIAGIPKSGTTLIAFAEYTGGKKGECLYKWLYSRKPITSKNIRNLPIIKQGSPYIELDDKMVGCYLAVEMTPVRIDDVNGKPVYSAIVDPIEKGNENHNEKEKINFTNSLNSGEVIEFNEPVTFYITDFNEYSGFSMIETSKSLEIKEEYVGKIIKIKKGDKEVILGEVNNVKNPQIKTFQISYDKSEVNSKASLIFDIDNISNYEVQILWIQSKNNKEKIVRIDTNLNNEYEFTSDDISSRIKARINIFDDKRHIITTSETEFTTPIKELSNPLPIIVGDLIEFSTIHIEYSKPIDKYQWLRSDVNNKWILISTSSTYTLTPQDVNKYIRVEVTLNNKTLTTTTTSIILPSMPIGQIELETNVIKEGDVIVPKLIYKGGIERGSKYIWEREGNIISNELTYRVQNSDVDKSLKFTYIPCRSDGIFGESISVITTEIIPSEPKIENVIIKQNKNELICDGKYSGGIEGNSIIIWRLIDQKTNDKIEVFKSNKKKYEPPKKYLNQFFDVLYVPIRNDDLKGEPTNSSNVICYEPIPELYSLDILVKGGEIKVGNKLRCVVECSDDCIPKYQWYRSNSDNDNWTLIDGANSSDYMPKDSDENCFLRCKVTPLDNKGKNGKKMCINTPDVVKPKLQIVNNDDNFFCGNEITTNFREEVVWMREMPMSGKWRPIVSGDVYLLNANDLGCQVKAVVEDFESKPTPVIQILPELKETIELKAKMKVVTFKAKSHSGETVWNVDVTENGFVLNANGSIPKKFKWKEAVCKAVEGTTDQIELHFGSSTEFIMIPFIEKEANYEKIVRDNYRDVIVCIVNKFKERISM